MIGILIYQSHDYIQYISFLTFLWYYLWKEYLCLMVIGRNVYNGCTFCYDIGLLLPIQEERVCLHVCVLGSVCSSMCVCWHYVCMCLWFSGGWGWEWREVIAHLCLSVLQSQWSFFLVFSNESLVNTWKRSILILNPN